LEKLGFVAAFNFHRRNSVVPGAAYPWKIAIGFGAHGSARVVDVLIKADTQSIG
jgi:hypothetical protein